MINYPAKKLWKGDISIRSTTVQKALENNEEIKVIFKDKEMILKPGDLMQGKWNDEIIQSKYLGTYKLVDYKWRPINNHLRLI